MLTHLFFKAQGPQNTVTPNEVSVLTTFSVLCHMYKIDPSSCYALWLSGRLSVYPWGWQRSEVKFVLYITNTVHIL